MSWEMVGRVFKESKADNGALLVMIGLANYSNDDDQSWPAVATLGGIARLSERQVRTNLRKLEAMGEIVPTGKGPKGTVRYKLSPGGKKLPPDETSGGHFIAAKEQKTSADPLQEPLDSNVERKAEFVAFVEQWHEAYQMQFDRKYTMLGGRDGKALKDLLAATDYSAGQLMKIATRAWANKAGFHCARAVSIAAFCRHFNEILAELAKAAGVRVPEKPKTAAPKEKSSKPPFWERPVVGAPHPQTGQPLTAKEIDELYPITNYEFDAAKL